MPRRLCIFAILAALAAVLAPALAHARPLRILTYNIHHASGSDGQYNLQRIADVINAANPDLVALQEVEQGTTRFPSQLMQLDELATRTGMTGIFGKTLNRLGGEYGNGVLINPEFEVISNLNHTMPNPGDGELRKVMEIRLQINDDGEDRRVNFFATHMDHTSGTNRQAQVQFINDLVETSNIPGILAGDFNFNDEGAAYPMLLEQWIDPTAASPGKSNQIDYVVMRGDDQWDVVTPGRFIINSTTNVASDHHPLLAVLELEPYTADFNGDGKVDGADLLSWQRNVGKTGPTAIGDANHDRVVNTSDRAIWAEQFVGNAAATAVPEPITFCLAATVAAVLAATRRHSAENRAQAPRLTLRDSSK